MVIRSTQTSPQFSQSTSLYKVKARNTYNFIPEPSGPNAANPTGECGRLAPKLGPAAFAPSRSYPHPPASTSSTTTTQLLDDASNSDTTSPANSSISYVSNRGSPTHQDPRIHDHQTISHTCLSETPAATVGKIEPGIQPAQEEPGCGLQ